MCRVNLRLVQRRIVQSFRLHGETPRLFGPHERPNNSACQTTVTPAYPRSRHSPLAFAIR
jgi:hypothetical protein